jgi:hypothetical protein
MPIETNAEIQALKASGDAETQFIALVTLKDGTKYRISTKQIFVAVPGDAAESFNPYLKQRITSRLSARKITDTIELSIQNVDLALSLPVLAAQYSLNGSSCIIWKVYIRPDGVILPPKEKVRGVLSQARIVGSTEVSVKLVPDTNYRARGRGSRTMQESCPFGFKVDPRCGSVDPTDTCSHDYFGSNGCTSKLPALVLINPVPPNNGPSYGGLIGTQSQPATGGTGGDGNTYEAENAVLTDAIVADSDQFSGGHGAQLNINDGSAEFRNVVGYGLNTSIAITYIASGARTCQIRVNGVVVSSPLLPGSGAGPATHIETINMPSGADNTITLVNVSSAAGALLYVDKITIKSSLLGGEGGPNTGGQVTPGIIVTTDGGIVWPIGGYGRYGEPPRSIPRMMEMP